MTRIKKTVPDRRNDFDQVREVGIEMVQKL